MKIDLVKHELLNALGLCAVRVRKYI